MEAVERVVEVVTGFPFDLDLGGHAVDLSGEPGHLPEVNLALWTPMHVPLEDVPCAPGYLKGCVIFVDFISVFFKLKLVLLTALYSSRRNT